MSARKASRRTLIPEASYGPPCATGRHESCRGTGISTGKLLSCECCDSGHSPGMRLAAAMRIYSRSDLIGETWEILAADYERCVARLDSARPVTYDADSPKST